MNELSNFGVEDLFFRMTSVTSLRVRILDEGDKQVVDELKDILKTTKKIT